MKKGKINTSKITFSTDKKNNNLKTQKNRQEHGGIHVKSLVKPDNDCRISTQTDSKRGYEKVVGRVLRILEK